MKYILVLLVLVLSLRSLAQSEADSLISRVDAAKTNKERLEVLTPLAISIISEKVDKWKDTSIEVIKHLKQKRQDSLADALELYVAYGLNTNGDYANSLQISMSIVERLIKRKDSASIRLAYNTLADSYTYTKNFDVAIINLKKAIPYIPLKDRNHELFNIYNSIADCYASAFMPDSGLVYAQKAMTLANDLKDEVAFATIYATTAENYIAKKEYDLALPFLRKALRFENNTFDNSSDAYVYNDFAQLFLGMKEYDSVYHYAKKAIRISDFKNWKDQLLRSYGYMYESFENQKIIDSSYKYYRLSTVLKDSLFDIEKLRSIESINFHEQLKEQEEELALAKAEEERQHTIQFALLAIGIISFIIIFLLLSRSMITSTRLIKFLSVVALLMVFEFLNLILHPFLEKVTHHSPILMLLSLVCIAALLVPLHHKIEHWATHKLVEKNKQIRLAAAKKTIEQLETDLNS